MNIQTDRARREDLHFFAVHSVAASCDFCCHVATDGVMGRVAMPPGPCQRTPFTSQRQRQSLWWPRVMTGKRRPPIHLLILVFVCAIHSPLVLLSSSPLVLTASAAPFSVLDNFQSPCTPMTDPPPRGTCTALGCWAAKQGTCTARVMLVGDLPRLVAHAMVCSAVCSRSICARSWPAVTAAGCYHLL